jgi:hypothetical protein
MPKAPFQWFHAPFQLAKVPGWFLGKAEHQVTRQD